MKTRNQKYTPAMGEYALELDRTNLSTAEKAKLVEEKFGVKVPTGSFHYLRGPIDSAARPGKRKIKKKTGSVNTPKTNKAASESFLEIAFQIMRADLRVEEKTLLKKLLD